MDIKQLKSAFQEMIEVMPLTDNGKSITIPKNADEKYLLEQLKEAIEQLEPGDEFSDETTEIINKIKNLNNVVIDEENEITEESPLSLIDQVEEAASKAVLVNIAKVNIEFKKEIKNLLTIKDEEDLRDEMIAILDTNPNQELEPKTKIAPKSKGKVKETKKVIENSKEILNNEIINRDITSIISQKPFNNLFDINPDILESIRINMEKNGYDLAYPVILWNDIVIDGNTRLQAAKEAGIDMIPTITKDFANEKEALEYAIHNQRNRRNLSEIELLHCIEILDKPLSKKEAGSLKSNKEKGKSNCGIKIAPEPTHKKTAKILGVGESKISEARTVLNDPKAKKDVETGKKTISKAAKEVREKKAETKSKNVPSKPKLDMISVIVEVLRNHSGEEIIIEDIITESFEILFDANGKTNAKIVGQEVNHSIEVLIAFEWIEKLDDGFIKISE
jgi:hypothetical protein